MLGRYLFAAALVAGGLSLAPARAAGPENKFLNHLVALPHSREGESFACFSRSYDSNHLRAHPRQNVVFAKALFDAYYDASSLAPARVAHMYQVSLAFQFRNRVDTLTGAAECGDGTPPDSLEGGAHCAGPQDTKMQLALDGRQALVMTLSSGTDLWGPGSVEKRHVMVKNPFGADDRVFRLVRTNLGECEDLAFDRQKPLRSHEP